MHSVKPLKIAIIGCGAVTEKAHLPASSEMEDVRVSVLVDRNRNRCEALARRFSVQHISDSMDNCQELFDAAIVALPHVLHAPVTISLLRNNKHVLVEKPMAISVEECTAMLGAAANSHAVLGVGLMRRFLTTHQIVHRILAGGILGEIYTFDFAEGEIYDWPVASDFFFRKETAAGGVLIDTGAHTLDSMLHWLGDFVEVDYFDDARGGVEANCLLKLRMKSGSSGTVELSRTRALRNTAIIRTERGILEVGLDRNALRFWPAANGYVVNSSTTHVNDPDRPQRYLDTMREQMRDWVDAIFQDRPPFVSGSSAVSSIRLIQTCYGNRQPLVLPWESPSVKESNLHA